MNLCEPQDLITLQHELLMSIGAHSSPEDLVKEFSFKAIKTLHLEKIHFFQKNNNQAGIEKNTFSIPFSALDIINENSKFDCYNTTSSPTDSGFIEEIKYKQRFFYCFGIKYFGFILLERRIKPFEEKLIQAVVPPIIRFAIDYLGRKQFELNTKQRTKINEISSALRIDNQKFETILGAIKDGVIAININKKIFFANKSAHAYIGVDNNTKFDQKYYEYFRLFTIDKSEDITRKLETFAIQNTIWSPGEPVVFKTHNGKTSVCVRLMCKKFMTEDKAQ